MIIGLDVGRNRPKLAMEGFLDSYPAAIGEWREIRLRNEWSKEDMDVSWRSKRYYVGRIAQLECDEAGTLQTESKIHNDTLLLGLCALHRAAPDGARIQLVTGLPIDYYNKRQRGLMRALFLGQHELSVDGIHKRFHIDAVDVVPESAAAHFAIEADECRVIDLGSRTTGYAQIIKHRFVDKLSGTLSVGAENFQGSRNAYVRYVVNALSRRWNLDDVIYLIGGMADAAAPTFKQYMPNVEAVENALYANAIAYHKMGVRKYGQTQQTLQPQSKVSRF